MDTLSDLSRGRPAGDQGAEDRLPTLVRDCQESLLQLGVPAFAGRGPTWNHGRIMPLLWMLAFEVGVATWAPGGIPLRALMISAPIVVFFAFLARPVSASALGLEDTRYGLWLSPLAVLAVLAFFAVRATLVPLREGDPIWLWPHPWSNAAVILLSLYAASFLLLSRSRPLASRQRGHRWIILVIVAVALVVCAIIYPVAPGVGESRTHVSVPSLVVAALVLTLALWTPRGVLGTVSDQKSYDPAAPAAVLLLAFGLTNGLLIYFFDSAIFDLVTAVVGGGVVLWAALGRSRFAQGKGVSEDAGSVVGERVRKQIEEPSLRLWIPFFLFAYPVVELFRDGWATFWYGVEFTFDPDLIALILFNAAYAMFVWFLVGFGVDHIVIWVGAEAWRKKTDTMKRMAGSTPVLLIVVIIFGLTAETWQIAAGLSSFRLGVLLASLFFLVVILVLVWSCALIRREQRFANWREVERQLGGCGNDKEFGGNLPERLGSVIRDHPCARAPDRRLHVMAWLNALLVLLVYQSFALCAVVVSLFLAILALVCLAVPSGVAAEWIYGDGQSAKQSELVTLSPDGYWQSPTSDDSVWASPWLRVSIFLALFSLLYFAAHSLADEKTRSEYFQGIDLAMRRRIAVYLCYRHLHHTPEFKQPDPAAPGTGGTARHGRPSS